MNTKDFLRLGVPLGETTATRDGVCGQVHPRRWRQVAVARAEPVKYHQWGEGLDHEAVMQMEKACLLEAQRDLVTVLGQFDPKLVKMAPAGERPED